MKKKIVLTLIFGVIFAGVTMTGVKAEASKGKIGLFGDRNSEKVSSSSTSSGDGGLYALRAGETPDLTNDLPGLDEGIGTATPITDATGLIVLSGIIYLGFIFIRKRNLNKASID
jgi:hypothetical protein